ncbi:hypothetical protein AN640_08115 [Candidatus Epulonipiscium fishelsonii]|uniref:Uncharacterized protein n=1 Tax=Candidatus Epulonipiscium fishelsonii TaxID=77094 RepID=A0ACC8XEA3_9FIRM|nr:hypothetical protein AN640_08115 [Epulopiscium sp. SCG-D08WGA-EpuloA1]OON95633.1 MAG: hypothetical protein ATN32_07020 [Epulopiscium sp. AS2M-Bin002]
MNIKTKRLVTLSLLIALYVILSRITGISLSPSIRVTFSFIAIALMGMLFGPVYAGIGAGIADIITATLFPIGAYFPGYTLSYIITGIIYGIAFYNKPLSLKRIIIANLVVILIVQLGLNTLWLSILIGKAFVPLVTTKIFKSLIMLPIEATILVVVCKYIYPQLKKSPHKM